MEFLLFFGVIILIIGALIGIILAVILFAMVKGLMKKHPKVDQAQSFIYRIRDTHFRRKQKQQSYSAPDDW